MLIDNEKQTDEASSLSSQIQLLPLFLLQLELLVLYFFLGSVVPEFGFVQVLLYVLSLLPDVFLCWTQTLLNDGTLD